MFGLLQLHCSSKFLMGIDWFRFKLKDHSDISLVKQLIEHQAVSFQSLFCTDTFFDSDPNTYSILEKIHRNSSLESSRELKKLLEFPECNEEKGCPEDIPNLDTTIRVTPTILRAAIFPPQWRILDCKTYLSEDLKKPLDKWRNWIDEVTKNQHEDYLREIHLYETIHTMAEHVEILKYCAIASLKKENNWANKLDFKKVRQKILELPEIECIQIRIDPQQPISDRIDDFDAVYRENFEHLREIIKLNKFWNSQVRGKRKIDFYEDRYDFDIEDFKESSLDEDWLNTFFDWVEQCIKYKFGLYLDY